MPRRDATTHRGSAPFDPPRRVRLDTLTWPEVAALDREIVVVVPFAAIEQHGEHLPLFTDTRITEGILERLDRVDAGWGLWLPVQRFGSSPHHMPFAGTLTLGSRTFLDVAGDLVTSIVEHGFRNVILLNGHGGNQALLDVAVQESRLRHRHLRIVHVTYWVVAAEAFGALRESPQGGMGHACEMETSIMLALEPSLVRSDRMRPDGEPPRSRFDHRDMLAPGKVGQFRFWDERSKTGPLGDPTTATAEKGERFLAAAADAVAAVVVDLRAGKLG